MPGPCLDWPGLMRVGLHELRLRPREFWALTPAEFAVMSGRDLADKSGPMTRSALEVLTRLYPDNGSDGDGQ